MSLCNPALDQTWIYHVVEHVSFFIRTGLFAIKDSLKYTVVGKKAALQLNIVRFKFLLWAEAIR